MRPRRSGKAERGLNLFFPHLRATAVFQSCAAAEPNEQTRFLRQTAEYYVEALASIAMRGRPAVTSVIFRQPYLFP